MFIYVQRFGIFLLLLRYVSPTTAPSEINALERLYNSTGGNSDTWNFSGINECLSETSAPNFGELSGARWDFTKNSDGAFIHNPCAVRSSGKNFAGVGCTCSTNQLCSITTIALPCGNLTGPPDVGALTNLASLYLSRNSLRGSLPLTLGSLKKLEHLNLDHNLLTGSIPSVLLGNLQNLQTLSVFQNSIMGTIPGEVGKLTNMEYMSLSSNSLSGSIPQEIGKLVKLTYLSLYSNSLSGSIPCLLGHLNKLSIIHLYDNSLMGQIPRELGNLTNLVYIHLAANLLTGSIPPSLGNATNLRYLDFSSNSIMGSLPGKLGKLVKLQYLSCYSNSLTGSIPDEFKNFANLEFLVLFNNTLTGSIPRELGNLPALINLMLSNNRLSGSIPSDLYRLGNLERLELYGNLLSGSIPNEFGLLQNLTKFDVSNNQLTGTIPASFSGLLYLTFFVVQGNNLQSADTVDDKFNYINPEAQQFLEFVDISGNNFTGSISESLFVLPSLQVLLIGSNCFSGELPSNICHATNLVTLGLSALSSGSSCRKYIWGDTILHSTFNFNAFVAVKSMQGYFPSCVFGLPSLEVLHANGNQLPAELPTTISSTLKTIAVSRNMIFGTISSNFASSADLTSLDLSNNRIGGSLQAFASNSVEQSFTRKFEDLKLVVNQISGEIPASLLNLNSIDILTGNVFACSYDKNKLPERDYGRDSYQCGSSVMNTLIYLFATMICVAMISLTCLRHLPAMQRCQKTFRLWLHVAEESSILDHDLELMPVMRYTRNLQAQRRFAIMIGVASIAVLICYVSLSGSSNRTVENLYGWAITSAYLTAPQATLTLLGTGIVFVSYVWGLTFIDKHIFSNECSVSAEDDRSTLQTEEKSTSFSMKLQIFFFPFFRLFFLFTFIEGVMLAGNYCYVKIEMTEATNIQNIFRFSFAGIKLLWTMLVTPYLFENEGLLLGVDRRHHDALVRMFFGGNYRLILLMNICSTFIIPMFAIAAVNETCFYHAFFQSEPVETTFFSKSCLLFLDGACISYNHYLRSSVSATPFTYAYTCSDSILKVYVPLYMQMSLLLLVKSISSLAYMCWDIFEADRLIVAETPGNMNMLMAVIAKLVPANQLLYGNNQRRDDYKSGQVYQTRIKFWISRSLPGKLAFISILLSFGFLAPPLAMMMISEIIIDSYVCQLVIGRFLETEISVLLEHNRQAEAFIDGPGKPELHFISLIRRICMENAIKDIDAPWGARAALKEVKFQCEQVPLSTIAEGRSVFVLMTAATIALLLIDVENSTLVQNTMSAGASIAMASYALGLMLCTGIYNRYYIHVNSKISHFEQCTTTPSMQSQFGIELPNLESAMTTEAEGSTKNPIVIVEVPAKADNVKC